MKAIALTAAGLLASTPVGAQTLKLPNEMLGTWCECTTQDPSVEEKDGTITIKYEPAIRKRMTRRSSWDRAATKAKM